MTTILDFPKMKAARLAEGDLFLYLEPEERGGGVDVCVAESITEAGVTAFSFVDLEVVSFGERTSVRRVGSLKGREDHCGEAG